jgi:hypothetical protein
LLVNDNCRLISSSIESKGLADDLDFVRSPHIINICVYEHACLYWVWEFSMYNTYLQKKYISMYIYPLSKFITQALCA